MDNVKIKTTITQENIEDLLCSAFEGGSNYWARTHVTKEQMEAVGAKYPFEVATRGGEIEVFDVDEIPDSEATDTRFGVINEARIRIAFELMSKGENEKGESKDCFHYHLNNILSKNADSETADVFFQIAVLGDIVFG